MSQMKVLPTLVTLALSGAAHAEISSTISLTNDYDFRGVTQSAKNPAVQASLDYADDKSGWYAGAWGSNVDFGDNTNLELDLYTGFTGKTDAGLGWDAGFVYYTYDQHQYNFPEIYTGFNYSYFNAKLSYSNDYGGDSTPGHIGEVYVSTGAEVPLPVDSLSINAHVGRSIFSGSLLEDYTDYSLGVGYKVQHFDLSLKLVSTDASPKTKSDVFNNETRVVFTVSSKLPW
jgi:uncharacterized protein (TIGR02001 family)